MAGDKTIWSVGGGKGGIGKSIATANIGCALARKGKSVILVDADLGGANLHTYFGIKYPEKGLDDFIKGRSPSLEGVAVETPVKNLRLISGAGEFLGIANPAYSQKQKLISHIKKLNSEYIIVDLGAGTSYNVLDFFAVSSEGIVVLVPEPAAIQNAYIFLKSFVYRRLLKLFCENLIISDMIKEATDIRNANSVKTFSDLCERISRDDHAAARKALAEIKTYRPKLLLNMASSGEDVKVVEAFKAASKTFLSLETEYIGVLYSRPEVKAAARKMRPFMLDDGAVEAHRDMDEVITKLLRSVPEVHEPVADGSMEQEVFGFNDNVNHLGTVFHVQTEAQGAGEPSIETVIYNGGRIFFSKKTLWKDTPESNNGANMREFAARQHRAAIAAIKMNKITFQG